MLEILNAFLQIQQSPIFIFFSAAQSQPSLLKVSNNLLLTDDSEWCAILLHLDLSAAFNTLACQILLEHLRRWAEIERTVLEGSSSSLEGRTFSVEKILLTLSMLGNISCITCKLFGGFHKAIYWAQFYFHYICFHWLKLINMHHISCHL